MRLLAIESATLEVGAAVFGPNGPIAAERRRPGRLHAESLHPAIAAVLERSVTAASELEAVAVDVGPGLFTGLRVGIAAAKGIAFSLHLPIVSVRSTEALRHDVCSNGIDGRVAVVPVIDMRRGEIAWELPDSPTQLGEPGDLLDALAGVTGDVLLAGDGALRWREEIAGSTGARIRFAAEPFTAPSVLGVGALGVERAESGQVTDAVSVDALYLRPPDARANFSTRQARQVASP